VPIIKQNTSKIADAIVAKNFRGGAPDFNSPVSKGAINPNRAMKFGELRPRIPKPRAIQMQRATTIKPAGIQTHYKPKGFGG
jgi:hypothetical protein